MDSYMRKGGLNPPPGLRGFGGFKGLRPQEKKNWLVFFYSLLIEFYLQTNINLNNKEKDNSLFKSRNRKRESICNNRFIQKSKGIWKAPKQLQNTQELLQINQNEIKNSMNEERKGLEIISKYPNISEEV